MRGEYCYPISNSAELLGSPPLARGIRGYYVILFSDERITPACAGNTLKSDDFGALLKDHPRLRGEYPSNLRGQKCRRGSPPLARGIPVSNVKLVRCDGITPACAGNTLPSTCQLYPNRDHPRLRGEYTFAV